jgi:hypothetical protein
MRRAEPWKCSRWNARTVVPPHDHQRNAMAAAVATTMAPLMTLIASAIRSVIVGQHAGWHNAGQLC